MREEEDKRKREEEKVKMEAKRKRQQEERRIREDEQKRMKEEEDKRKREEKVKIEAKRKRQEEERRIREEEQRRVKEEEDKRKRQEENVKMEAERKRQEEERRISEEEQRRMKEEEDKRKKEEKVKMEAERKRQEEERRIREEAQRRMKEEEDKRKGEEEKVKMEADRKRKEEETRRKKEEEIIIEEMKCKKGEEERRKMEREEKWREEERIMIDLERRKLENEVRMMQEEQKKERAEEVERGKEDKIEEATKEMEKMETARKGIIEIRLKKEDECRKRKERKDKEGRVTEEIKERKEQVGETEKKKEADDRKKMAQEKMDEEMRNGDKNGNIDEEIKLKRKKTEEMHRKRLEEEKDRKNMEEGKDSKEVVRNQEGENRKIEEEQRPIAEDEKNADERKTEEEERGRRQTEKMRRQRNEDNYRKSEEDMRLKEENDLDNRKREHESKTKDKEEERRKRDEGNTDSQKEQNGKNVEENKEEVNKTMGEEMRIKEKEKSKNRMMQVWEKEVKVVKAHELQKKREEHSMKGHNEKKRTYKRENSSPREDSTSWSSSNLGSIICPDGTEAIPQHDLNKKISQTSARPSTGSVSLPVCLPEHTEQRRLSWMKDCIPWSKLSLKNRRKQNGSARSRRVLRRAAEASSLPPLCPESLLQSTGWKSLHEVTTVSLEDLPGCSLSTLAQCTQLCSLSLRRCSLKSLEGINHLPQLCYIDVQENDISFINCENMISLRVLKLEHNKLTSIHGLAGAENLDVLHLSHNSITRIAGLESVRRLQRLSLDHNQLISTKGLRDVYTLLHLNCSHNHLASVEGLENSALLNTLDLRANSLTEPPSLNNHVLLRELQLDDNSISSLQSLTACWLPLLQHLSVAQNRITQLPSVSDFVSLENLDLRFNCMSELQTVCESLEGCHLLQKVHLTGNPLQQESGWRSTLQKAVPGLRVIDDQWTDSFLSPPAAQQVTLASGSFLAFCQAQLQQTHDLQQQHSRELSKASSPLDPVNISCQHFTEALQLAADQRFAHEYGDTNVADKHRAVSQTIPEETVDMGSATAEKHSECPEIESTEKVPPVRPISDNIGYSTFDEKSDAESRHDTFYTDATPPQTGPAVSKVNSGSVTKRKANSTNLKIAPVLSCQDLDRRIAAAVVIQQLWRKYRQKCGNISSPSTAEKRGGRGGDGVMPRPGPSYINGSVVGQDHAATVIQAFWRGFTLRRRFTSALAAVTCSDSGEDDTLEEVDMDEFVLDEAALEKHWTLPLCEDPPLRRYPVSEQPLSLKPPQPFPEPSQYILPPPVERKSKQAWVAPEQVDSERQGVSTSSSNRSKSPASTSVVSGLSKRSEKILEEWGFTNHHTALLMLKRAQNMKSKKHQQKRRREPSVRLALFRNCGFQPDPVEARHSCNVIKVGDVELGLQQAERTERVKSDQARQWLHNQTAHSDGDSESMRFLPEISSDILNGGRVQLVADPGYTERLHHASGLWANSSLTAQPCREKNYARRNSLGHAREDVPSSRGATSAPSLKERISFRDNPVQLSGGWGGGKKRGKVYK